jgi:hypothetical protein
MRLHRNSGKFCQMLPTISEESPGAAGNPITSVWYEPNPYSPPLTSESGEEIYPPSYLVEGNNTVSELVPVPRPKDARDGNFTHRPIGRINEGSPSEKQSGSVVFSPLLFTVVDLQVAVRQLAMGLKEVLAGERTRAERSLILMEPLWPDCLRAFSQNVPPPLDNLKSTGCGAGLRIACSRS